ncbi:MAG: TetR/AcrR family transcriptional regulator [Pseudomonadales bacterium]|nr:TetR/AcrR family transcriptional regulator [Pseudomonadales bacterium]
MLLEPNLSRSEQRNLEFKQRITDAAIALFVELGVNETPVTAIIKKAGIAHKTFFNHFPSKQHLLSYIACDYANGLLQLSYDPNKTAFDALDEGFMQMATQLQELDESLQSVIRNLLICVPTGPIDVVEKQTKNLSDGVKEVLIQAERLQQLQPGFSIETYTEVITGIAINTVINWAGQEHYPLQERMTAAVAFIHRSVFIIQ